MQTIRELLDDLDIEYVEAGQHHHAHEGWIQIDCPFCAPNSQKFHMGYKLSGGYMSCWMCGKHDTVEVLATITGRTHQQIKRLLVGVERDRRIYTQSEKRGVYNPPRAVGPLLRPHRRYLRDRGFDVEMLERLWNLKGLGICGRMSWRIFVPVEHEGVPVSWTTRSIAPEATQRYISAKKSEELINHKHLIYGEDYCRYSIIVVEGAPDAWKIGPGCGAILGLSITRQQIARISKYPVRAICFDNQPAAQRRAQKLCDLLGPLPGETYNIQLDSKDAAEAKNKDIRQLRKHFLE